VYNLGEERDMPIHDWTQLHSGAFHHFHGTWLIEIARALNDGILPEGFYALGEQVVGGAVPDVLTLEARSSARTSTGPFGGLDASDPIPTATITAIADPPLYPTRPRVIAVRHVSGDRLIALIEIVSAGNKSDAAELGALVEKTVVALSKGIHVTLADLHPPGPLDPKGLHNSLWAALGQEPIPLPHDRPLTFASYMAGPKVRSFIEPRAVGEDVPDIPLFLAPDRHVAVPFAKTYASAFDSLPAHLKAKLQGR